MTFALKMVKSSAMLFPDDGWSASWKKVVNFPGQAAIFPRMTVQEGIMAVFPKEPFGWLNHFRQQMDEVFSYLTALEGREGMEHDVLPPVDMYETADSMVVEIELPGFDPEQISVRSCYTTLVVNCFKREERPAGLNFICMERKFGRFSRAIEMPPDVDANEATARYEKGLLSVVFPKLPGKKMIIREIPIE